MPPAVTVSHSPISSGLVTITCHVQRFYPENVHIIWLEDCHTLKGTAELVFKRNTDGSYTKQCSQLVNISVQGPERVFTCRVQQEKQDFIQASLILPTTNKSTESPGKLTSFIIVSWVTPVSWVDFRKHRERELEGNWDFIQIGHLWIFDKTD